MLQRFARLAPITDWANGRRVYQSVYTVDRVPYCRRYEPAKVPLSLFQSRKSAVDLFLHSAELRKLSDNDNTPDEAGETERTRGVAA